MSPSSRRSSSMEPVFATLTTSNAAATCAAGEQLARFVRVGDVILLSGDLGAGKTQLTKGLARGLGVDEEVTSPTFNILLVHDGRVPLYHADLYRLERADQLEDIDWWGMLEGGGVAVVEWGDRFPDQLPADYLDLRLGIVDDQTRRIDVLPFGARATELAAAWVDALAATRGVEVVQ